MLVGGAMMNALAFSGSNYLFSMLRSSDLNEERERHEKAVEQLQAAQAEWSRRRTERLDWISEDLRRQGHAVQTFRDVDDAIREYWRTTENNLTPWDLMPKLSDFYVPITSQRDREIAFVVLGIDATGLVAYKLAKYLKKMACCGSASIAYPQHVFFCWPDQPPGDNWTASWVRGFRMLEAYRVVGIPQWR